MCCFIHILQQLEYYITHITTIGIIYNYTLQQLEYIHILQQLEYYIVVIFLFVAFQLDRSVWVGKIPLYFVIWCREL